MPLEVIRVLDLPANTPEGGDSPIKFDIGSYMEFGETVNIRTAAGHFQLQTVADDKNARINSRDVPQTSGSHSGAQIKPNGTGTGTASLTGLEVSPRFAAGIAGADIVAIKADPLLKAGSGNLSGAVVAVQANIDFGESGTRTITGDVVAFESFLAVPSTYTYSGHKTFLKVRTVNIASWDYFLKVEASTGLAVVSAGTYSTADGYLKIRVAGSDYRIAFFAAVD